MDVEAGKAVLFKNDKEGNPNRPDYRGELKTPGGEQLQIALWISESGKGLKYFSGKVQPLQEQNGSGAETTTTEAAEAAAAAKSSSDDDIPF